MFEKVYEQEIQDISLYQINNPKEITCKGGLLCGDYSKLEDIEEKIKTTLLGDQEDTLVTTSHKKLYQDISEEQIDSVTAEVQHFIDLFFGIHADFDFHNKFGVKQAQMEQYKQWLSADLKQYTISGLRQRNSEPGETVYETLFFYPLIGALNKLAYRIYSEGK
jgi:hypothetical protein